jgi:ribosomal peptide maturation radical SAM protein 1
MKIHLVNMPFAAVNLPSIALTQLKSVMRSTFGDGVSVEIHYLNQDFPAYLGADLYAYVSSSMDAQNTGFGDWFFRQSAFPDLPDNTEAYYRRYFPYRSPQIEMVKRIVMEKRRGLDHYLDELIAKYELEQADAVGFTSMFNQNIACFALARRIKERNGRILTVMGGANCETPMGQEIAKNVKQIDYVFSGPALKNFPQFIQQWRDGELEQCEKIKGVFTKTNCAGEAAQSAIGEELDINVEVELDYDKFMSDTEKNFPNGAVKPIVLFETSRGCWWGQKQHCTFCGLNGTTMAYRAMDTGKAVNLMNSLFRYAPRAKRFESVDNIMPKEYLTDVFPALATPSDAYLFYEVKADLSEDDMRVLSRARVKIVQPGIESLATSTLKLMRKGTTAFQNIFLLKNCLKYDISPAWNLLVGFPGEGEEVYRKYLEDIPMLMHLPPPHGSFPVRFDRYSPYFVRAKEYELDLHPYAYYELIYPFSEESLANLAYYFEDRNIAGVYMGLMVEWLGKVREKVNLWQTRWGGSDQVLRPKLYFKENSTVVYDSRSGKAVEHQVGAVGKQVLEYLTSKPARIATLASGLAAISDIDFAKVVAALLDKGLVFEEGERYMSLVLPKDFPPMTYGE